MTPTRNELSDNPCKGNLDVRNGLNRGNKTVRNKWMTDKTDMGRIAQDVQKFNRPYKCHVKVMRMQAMRLIRGYVNTGSGGKIRKGNVVRIMEDVRCLYGQVVDCV